MQKYIARRLLLFVPTLFLASVLVFLIVRVAPGDPVDTFFGTDPTLDAGVSFSQEQRDALREELDLDHNVVVQYGLWVADVFTLNPGESFRTQEEVLDVVKSSLPLTLELAFATMIIAVLVALPLGIISAIRQDTWLDYGLRVFSIGFLAMPIFWTGIIALVIAFETFRWGPPVDYADIWEDPWLNIRKLWLPVLILALNSAAVLARMLRSATLEVLRQDYVRTAFAKGLRERTVVVRHVVKNSLLPVVTVAGIQFAVLFSGTVITEQLFNLPGVGKKLILSLDTSDFPIIQFVVVLVALFVTIINLLVDLLYGYLDPRIRYE